MGAFVFDGIAVHFSFALRPLEQTHCLVETDKVEQGLCSQAMSSNAERRCLLVTVHSKYDQALLRSIIFKATITMYCQLF